MKVQLLNIGFVDVMIDLKGENKPEDKVIIHPKNKILVDIKEELFSSLKSVKGLSVTKVN